jgi:uncharacterized protein (TIGR02611 family)
MCRTAAEDRPDGPKRPVWLLALRLLAHHTWRFGVLVVGSLVLLAGVIMIFTPGPAVVFIPMGLGILAIEFAWARRLLRRVRLHIRRAARAATRRKPDKPRDLPT